MRKSVSSVLCVAGLGLVCQGVFGGVLLTKVADVEPGNNTIAGAPVVALGEQGRAIVFRASLTTGDTDIYRCNLGNNGQVTFITTPVGGGPSDPFTVPDTVVSILNAGGSVLATNDDAGGGTGNQFGSIARYDSSTPADTVYFRVTGLTAAQVGEYIVTIIETFGANTDWTESASNETAATADILDLRLNGAMHGKGTLTTNTDVDVFGIDMLHGETLVMCTTPVMTNWLAPDTIVDIIDTNGTTVLFINDDDGCTAIVPNVTSRGSAVRFKAPKTGRYYVRVRGFQGATGEYRASFALIPPAEFTCDGDADGNGVVNFADITNVLANFNMTCP
ncbi:MAG: hypothetical protein JNK58_08480 [Phycisphaerae bacterium]|nr:hypothetical protein [Phycisphaerae bacterium]